MAISITNLLNQTAKSYAKKDDKQRIGIGNFIMEARIREELNYTADVPAIHLEDGSTANDHIILNPVRIDIEGNVADIIAEPNPAVQTFINTNRTAGRITKYAPKWTQAQISKINALALTARDAAARLDNLIDDGQSALELTGRIPADSGSEIPIMHQFMDSMKLLYFARKPFKIEIYGLDGYVESVYENMFMTSWVSTFENTEKAISYKMSLTQIRFVTTEFVFAAAPKVSDETKGSTDSEVNNGLNTGKKVELQSVAYGGGFKELISGLFSWFN
jgi:hypothetical protein